MACINILPLMNTLGPRHSHSSSLMVDYQAPCDVIVAGLGAQGEMSTHLSGMNFTPNDGLSVQFCITVYTLYHISSPWSAHTVCLRSCHNVSQVLVFEISFTITMFNKLHFQEEFLAVSVSLHLDGPFNTFS